MTDALSSWLFAATWKGTLLVAFVPLVWRRLSDTTRLVAALHLGLALVAIRKMGEMHIGAASVLLALLGVLGAFDLVRSLADSPAHVVPGHDPLVMERFPPAKEGLEGIAVRIA